MIRSNIAAIGMPNGHRVQLSSHPDRRGKIMHPGTPLRRAGASTNNPPLNCSLLPSLGESPSFDSNFYYGQQASGPPLRRPPWPVTFHPCPRKNYRRGAEVGVQQLLGQRDRQNLPSGAVNPSMAASNWGASICLLQPGLFACQPARLRPVCLHCYRLRLPESGLERTGLL